MTYNVLMGIHENVKSIISCQFQYFNGMLYPLLIVDSWSRRFNGLPRKNVSDSIVAPTFQPREMNVCIFDREWSGTEVDSISIEEVFWNMRRLIWMAWTLGISGQIDTPESDFSAMRVAEMAVLDCESQWRHDMRLSVCKGRRSNSAVRIASRALQHQR